MKIFSKLIIFSLLALLIMPAFAFAQEPEAEKQIEIYLFVQQGCPHCAKAEKQLDEWKESKYPQINVKKFDIVEKENLLLFLNTQQAYDFQSQGVPTIFIGEKVVVGEQYDVIEETIKKCLEQACPNPSEIIQNYIDRQAAANNEATPDETISDNQDQTDKTSKNIIIFGIVIIGIICVFIIYRIMKK